MIAKLAAHPGGADLVRHLLDSAANETVTLKLHGLASETLMEAVEELVLMASGARTSKPLLHAICSPSRRYSDDNYAGYWDVFESEFRLIGQPYAEVRHQKRGKGGRTAGHVHRIYLRVRIDRSVIPLHASYPRQEKVARIAEVDNGERLTKGRFNRAVAAALDKGGRADVADAMRRVGLLAGETAIAPSSAERAASERVKGMAADEIWRRVWAAWTRGHEGASLLASLASAGMRLGQGDKTIQIVAPDGQIVDLRRALRGGSSAAGQTPPRKKEIEVRLKGVVLPPVSEISRPEPRPTPPILQITGRTRSPIAHAIRPGNPEAREPVPANPPQRSTATGRRAPNPEQLSLAKTLHRSLAGGALNGVRSGRAALDERAAKGVPNMAPPADQRERSLVARSWTPAPPRPPRPVIQAIRRRYVDLKADTQRSWVGTPGEWDRFRAGLAGIPPEFGSLLRWVEREEGGRVVVSLHSGTVLHATPLRVTVSEPSLDTVDVIVAHALRQRWRAVEIRGGSPEWQEALIKAANLAGLPAAVVSVTPAIPVRPSGPQPSDMRPFRRASAPGPLPKPALADDGFNPDVVGPQTRIR